MEETLGTLLFDKVLVRRIAPALNSPIYDPSAVKEKSLEGIVLEVGPGRWEHGQFIKTTVTKGARVIFGQYSATNVEIDGQKDLVVMHEDNIHVVLPPKNDDAK